MRTTRFWNNLHQVTLKVKIFESQIIIKKKNNIWACKSIFEKKWKTKDLKKTFIWIIGGSCGIISKDTVCPSFLWAFSNRIYIKMKWHWNMNPTLRFSPVVIWNLTGSYKCYGNFVLTANNAVRHEHHGDFVYAEHLPPKYGQFHIIMSYSSC